MKPVLKSFQTPPAALALVVAAVCALGAAPVAAQTRAALVHVERSLRGLRIPLTSDF